MTTLVHRIVRVAIAVGLLAAAPTRAQDAREERLKVPYNVGERLEYEVRFGKVHVGSGSIEVVGVDDVRGRETWHTVYQVHGGLRFLYSIDDVFESWIDTHTGNSLRFRKEQNEGRHDRESIYNMFPDRGIFIEDGDTAEVSVKNPLDEGSFLFFVRTLPLVVGQTYPFDRYFKPDRNPVTIKVMRKERIKVPAGEFNAIVIQPIIKTPGIFSEDGHAEIWLSDDPNRIILQMKSGLSFGSINLYLTSYRPAKAGATAPSQ